MQTSRSLPLASASKLILAALFVVAPALVVGCSSTSSSRAEGTADTASTLREEYLGLHDEIGVTMRSLDGVTSAGAVDLSGAYKSFASRLKRLQSRGRRVANASEGMQRNSRKYIESWQARITEVQNPEIRALAEQRSSDARDRFETTKTELSRVQEDYARFTGNLQDIAIVLEADLSQAGVEALQGVIQTANSDADSARADIEKIVELLDGITSALSSGPEAADGEASAGDNQDS